MRRRERARRRARRSAARATSPGCRRDGRRVDALRRRPRRARRPKCRRAVPRETLDRALRRRSSTLPPRLPRQPQGRARPRAAAANASRTGEPLDWGTGEMLAYASLARRGHADAPQRAGRAARHVQPSPRGARRREDRRAATRRSRTLGDGAGRFEVYDSPLSEAGVLGFDYGYSLDYPDGARDLGGAVRRLRQQRAGHHRPVHRLGRGQVAPPLGPRAAPAPRLRGPGPRALERAPRALPAARPPRTTSRSATSRRPAQIFHVLRRQVLRPWRKPLVIMTPKSLLRHQEADVDASTTSRTGAFQRVIRDDSRRRSRRRRSASCSARARSTTTSPRRARELGATTSRSSASSSSIRSSDALAERARPVQGRHAARLGAGRAVEHGRLVLHQRAPARAARTAASRSPACRAPRARARPPARTRATSSSRRCCSTRRSSAHSARPFATCARTAARSPLASGLGAGVFAEEDRRHGRSAP